MSLEHLLIHKSKQVVKKGWGGGMWKGHRSRHERAHNGQKMKQFEQENNDSIVL